MNSIKQDVKIEAPIGRVYDALSREAGYRGWWNKRAEVPEAAGAEAKLYFVKDGSPVNMRFRIDETRPNARVRWTCTAHDMPSWVGTTLDWKLESDGATTLVSFEHGGWKDDAPEPVAQGWRHFLSSFKAYVERGSGEPW